VAADEFPLLELFTQLRKAGLPLGIGEYQWVLKAWQAGYGTADRAALARLCRTVWVKSPEEARIFESQFERLVPQLPPRQSVARPPTPQRRWWFAAQTAALAVFGTVSLILAANLLTARKACETRLELLPLLLDDSAGTLYATSARLPAEDNQPPAAESPDSPAAAETPADSVPLPQEFLAAVAEVSLIPQEFFSVMVVGPATKPWWQRPGLVLWIGLWLLSGACWYWLQSRSEASPGQRPIPRPALALTLTQQIQDEVQIVRLGQAVPTGDYFPVTRRQMKQSWRYLRRLVREGPPTELDVEATVHDIGRQGVLLTPVFRPRRVNRAQVLLLIDQDGSMVPFHGLSQRLVQTALQGGRLTQVRIYYFHNCPGGYLYRDPYQQTADSIEQMLQSIASDYAGILIVSDAGAAHGGYNPQRLTLTERFLQQVSQRVRYLAWLNPMPQPRWTGTTAAAIAQRVPMFEFDRAGLDAAIGVLRGQGRRHS